MQKDIFYETLKRKVSYITFTGHRVNDSYSINKRKHIVQVVMSAFDEAAEHGVQPTDESLRYLQETLTPRQLSALKVLLTPLISG